MWISYYILLSLVLYQATEVLTDTKRRQKRYLLFTTDTQWGVFATISVPLHPETTVSLAWFFEANYYNVDNATYFEPLLGDITISRTRDKRGAVAQSSMLTRRGLYTSLESLLQQHDFFGRPCLLRAICENASSHFLHNGLLGDLIHLVLTPSTSMLEEDLEDCYYEAEHRGLDDYCEVYTGKCPMSPLEYISIYIEGSL